MTLLLAALVSGAVIGLSLGALGGGGSILAVPALVFLLDQRFATTGSLVVVGVTAIAGSWAAHRARTVRLARGVAFGLVATGGAVVGGHASTRVSEDVLLAAFSALMLVVGGVMVAQLLRARKGAGRTDGAAGEPILTFRPRFSCRCPRALMVLVAATAVGLVTGFLGVGGGFLVVPALVLALSMPMREAAGTSLVVIAVTSAAALAARTSSGAAPEWTPVLVLTATAVAFGWLGVRVAGRVPAERLSSAFTAVVVASALGTAAMASPHLSDPIRPRRPPEERFTMCRAVTCRTCGRTTWAGCGQHVEQVMRGVPAARRCPGHEPVAGRGLWARLTGR